MDATLAVLRVIPSRADRVIRISTDGNGLCVSAASIGVHRKKSDSSKVRISFRSSIVLTETPRRPAISWLDQPSMTS